MWREPIDPFTFFTLDFSFSNNYSLYYYKMNSHFWSMIYCHVYIVVDVSLINYQSLWEMTCRTSLDAHIIEVIFFSKLEVISLLRSSICYIASHVQRPHALSCEKDSRYHDLEEVHDRFSRKNCLSSMTSLYTPVDGSQKYYLKQFLYMHRGAY